MIKTISKGEKITADLTNQIICFCNAQSNDDGQINTPSGNLNSRLLNDRQNFSGTFQYPVMFHCGKNLTYLYQISSSDEIQYDIEQPKIGYRVRLSRYLGDILESITFNTESISKFYVLDEVQPYEFTSSILHKFLELPNKTNIDVRIYEGYPQLFIVKTYESEDDYNDDVNWSLYGGLKSSNVGVDDNIKELADVEYVKVVKTIDLTDSYDVQLNDGRFDVYEYKFTSGIYVDYGYTSGKQASIQWHSEEEDEDEFLELYDFHNLDNTVVIPEQSSDREPWNILVRISKSKDDNKLSYLSLVDLLNKCGGGLPGDSDVLENDSLDIGSIHKANDYYELHHINDERTYPWNAQDLFNVQNEYWDFDNSIKVKTPYQSIQDYGNIDEQETQFLVKTTLRNGGENLPHQSLEYRKLNLDLKLPYCDSYLAMNAMGSNHSIELGSVRTVDNKEIPYFQLDGFSYQADVPKVIQLDWPNEEGTSGTYNLGTTVQRYITETNRYIEYDNIVIKMPAKPEDHSEDIWNIYNQITNINSQVEYIITEINNIWSRIQELENNYWPHNGDYTTCYGQSIGDSDGNKKIDLMSKADDDSYYQDVAVEGSFKANYVKAQNGLYIGTTFISEEQLQQLLELLNTIPLMAQAEKIGVKPFEEFLNVRKNYS